jgi:hypothetical protein
MTLVGKLFLSFTSNQSELIFAAQKRLSHNADSQTHEEV